MMLIVTAGNDDVSGRTEWCDADQQQIGAGNRDQGRNDRAVTDDAGNLIGPSARFEGHLLTGARSRNEGQLGGNRSYYLSKETRES